MILLSLEGLLGHKHREVAPLHAHLLDLAVKKELDVLPNRVGPRAEDVAAAHVVVVDHLTPGDYIAVPRREVLLLLGREPELRPALLLLLLLLGRLVPTLLGHIPLLLLLLGGGVGGGGGVGEVDHLGVVPRGLEELDEVRARDARALVVVERVEPERGGVGDGLVDGEGALVGGVVEGSERGHAPLDHVEHLRQELVRREAALGRPELLA
mmetsp:Transcript_40594/g.99693  ORF Transcript_40594/g.99693 Transcript_40594/m.99693 type:complete len:211 (+) Transcript_40594:1340-1972(+)